MFDQSPPNLSTPGSLSSPNIAVFTGGSFNSPGIYTDLLQSTFTTVVLWSVRVDPLGNMSYAGPAGSLATNGVFNPNADAPTTAWQQQVVALKNTAGSPVTRVELCFGVGSSPPDETFPNIMAIYNAMCDSGRKNLLDNLKAVKTALNLDAICFDDEVQYDLASSLWFAQAARYLGMTVTIAPYCMSNYWSTLVSAANANGTLIDANYLQCFSSGLSAEWTFGGLNPVAGMWLNQSTPSLSPTAATQQLQALIQSSPRVTLSGGWYYNAGEILANANLWTFNQYSQAIADALA